VTIDIAVTNNNPPACAPMQFELNVDQPGLRLDPSPTIVDSPPVASGDTTHLTFTATPYDTVPGPGIDVTYELSAPDWLFNSVGDVEVDIAEPAGCHVSKERELTIRDLSVITDPTRTSTQGPIPGPFAGAWTFQHLVEEMAPTPADAPDVAEDLVRSYLTPQVINGFTVDARPGWSDVLGRWPRTANGKLDLAQAPFQLDAIVNRIDLRDLDHGNAGEASFVFSVVEGGLQTSASLIFEYALAAIPFSEPYNAALQAITDRVVQRGASPGSVNGSALIAVRSNEFPFGGPDLDFQLREFRLSPQTGRLVPSPLDRTPDQSFMFRSELTSFLQTHRDAILAGTQTVPDQIDGQPFRAGAAFIANPGIWNPSGVDPDLRAAFALSTCNGCHSPQETGALFAHLAPSTFVGVGLSPFLTGVTIPDPVTGQPRQFNDMLRRRTDLEAIVCPPQPTVSLRHGIDRVH
jgi:hypothetical protein